MNEIDKQTANLQAILLLLWGWEGRLMFHEWQINGVRALGGQCAGTEGNRDVQWLLSTLLALPCDQGVTQPQI